MAEKNNNNDNTNVKWRQQQKQWRETREPKKKHERNQIHIEMATGEWANEWARSTSTHKIQTRKQNNPLYEQIFAENAFKYALDYSFCSLLVFMLLLFFSTHSLFLPPPPHPLSTRGARRCSIVLANSTEPK